MGRGLRIKNFCKQINNDNKRYFAYQSGRSTIKDNKYIAFFLISLSIIFVVMLCATCQKQDVEEKQSYKLYSLLIDDLGGPLPPPPPKYGEQAKMDQKFVDSLLNQKQTLAIYPFMQVGMEVAITEGNLKDFREVIDRLNSFNRSLPLNIKEINSKKGHTLVIADTIKLKKTKEYYKLGYDYLIHLSRVAFNPNYSKAAFIASSSTSSLAGVSLLYLCQKKDGKWKITKSKELRVW